MTISTDLVDENTSSPRAFGITVAIVFVVLGVLPLFLNHQVKTWPFIVAAAFLIPAIAFPRLLSPLNFLWSRFGLLLASITTPIAMSILFYIVLTPTAFLLRMFGKDLLRLKREESAKSYWLIRDDSLGSMKNQF